MTPRSASRLPAVAGFAVVLVLVGAVSWAFLGQKPANGSLAQEGATGAAPKPGEDELIIRLPVQALNLNPTTHRTSYDTWMLEYLISPLYTLDKETGAIVPELALALPEKSEDGLTWTIRLRQDARWHDGKPVTARDLKASLDLMKNPKVDAARLRKVFDNLLTIEVVDAHTARLQYSERYWFALYALSDFPLVPAHVVEKLEAPEDWNEVDRTVGCGPYRLESWKRDDRIVLVRNEEWFGAKPNLKRITYRYIRDDVTGITALRRGEVDASAVSQEMWIRQLEKDAGFRAKVQVLEYYRPRFFYLGWNLARPMFADRRTRTALAMLLDIEALNEELFYGQARQVTGPFFFRSSQYDPTVEALPYDPRRAVQLLREAGWTDADGDGTLEKDGKDFAFSFPITPGNPLAEGLATFVKDAYKRAGIRVNIESKEFAVFLQQIQKRDFDCCALAWSWSTPDHEPYQVWHSSAIAEQGSNHFGFRNAEADAIMEKARREFDVDARNALYHRLHRILYQEQPCVFLLSPMSILVVDKRFRGLREYPTGILPRIAFEWWVPKGLEKRAR